MIICLDYDDTYTLDPEFWEMVIAAAQWRGHTVILATMRYPAETDYGLLGLGKSIDVIFTSRQAKRPFLAELGYRPDVWIDDSQHWIYQDAL